MEIHVHSTLAKEYKGRKVIPTHVHVKRTKQEGTHTTTQPPPRTTWLTKIARDKHMTVYTYMRVNTIILSRALRKSCGISSRMNWFQTLSLLTSSRDDGRSKSPCAMNLNP